MRNDYLAIMLSFSLGGSVNAVVSRLHRVELQDISYPAWIGGLSLMALLCRCACNKLTNREA